jgi:hypothetical protein
MSRLSADALDEILALQLTVAWAGEKNARPARLTWWRTDILDEAGARDLLSRLTPRTQEWAALEAVREAARRADERIRLRSAAPDRTVTLFHLGFELDEQLGERLGSHKRGGATPGEVFGSDAVARAWGIARDFDRNAFEAWCGAQAPRPKTEDTPDGGRRVLAPPVEPRELARSLVSGLVPFSSEYPMPHMRFDG